MLKKRIIPVQLLMGERLVKTIRFENYRDVGDPVKSSAVYDAQAADELILLSINREGTLDQSLAGLIERVSRVCFMPLAAGGGIRTYEDSAFLIRNGADKVILNSVAYGDPDVIRRTADAFGAQAVTVGIDVRWDRTACRYILFSHCGRCAEGIDLEAHVRRCVALGAGEIFVQSIDRDGTMAGFDLNLINVVMASTDVPVIACGGAGNYEHLRDAFISTGVGALACGSIFNFSDSNPMRAKAFLTNVGLPLKVV